jgi:hypothetical protein
VIKVPIEAKVPQMEIRHKGLYDLDSIYKTIRQWLKVREYDYNEARYKDKKAEYGNEVEHIMQGEIQVTNFVKYNINIETKFYGVNEFESELAGEKRKVNKGQFFIILNGTVTYDYNNNFSGPKAQKFLKILVTKIFKNYYDVKYLNKLYYELYNLQTELKKEAFMETSTNAY